MPRSFAITTSAPLVQLNGAGQGEVTFTVSNAVGRPLRARVVLEPEGALTPGWLALVGEPERELAPDGTQSYSVKLAAPPSAAEGSYAFHLVVVNVANPDEEFAVGPSVSFQVRRAAAPVRQKFPMWAAFLVAGVLLIAVSAVGTGLALRYRGTGTGGSGNTPTVSLSFNGQSSYVDLGQPSVLDFTGNVTVEAWIRPRATDGLRNIVSWGYTLTPPGEFMLRIFAGQYQTGSWNGQSHTVSAPMPPEDVGQWVHLAGVYDGTHWRLYRNGKELASNPDSVGVLPVRAPWAIGARATGSERFFQGDIAEVNLWKVARTPEQLNEDMRRAPKDNAPGLVGSWSLGEGRGTLVKDRSQGQSHGVVRGAEWNTR